MITADPWEVEVSQPGSVDAVAPLSGTLEGLGRAATAPFTLQAGMTTFRWIHIGAAPFAFALRLLDTTGSPSVLVTVGSTDERGEFSAPLGVPGAYLLDILADGAWTVTIDQ